MASRTGVMIFVDIFFATALLFPETLACARKPLGMQGTVTGLASEEELRKTPNLDTDDVSMLSEDDLRYSAYSELVSILRASMNLSEDPCTNFYEYVCGNHSSKPPTVVVSKAESEAMLAKLLERRSEDETELHAIKQSRLLYKKCFDEGRGEASTGDGNDFLSKLLEKFKAYTGLTYSWFQLRPGQPLNPENLGKALGFLSSLGLSTLIDAKIFPDDRNPERNVLYIDTPVLSYESQQFYASDIAEQVFARDAEYILNATGALYGQRLPREAIKLCTEWLFAFEKKLAEEYRPSDVTKNRIEYFQDAVYLENPADYAFIDFDAFVDGYANGNQKLANYFQNCSRCVQVFGSKWLKKLSKNFYQKFDPGLATNYLYFRIVREYFWYTQIHDASGENGADSFCAGEVLKLLKEPTQRLFVNGLRATGHDDSKALIEATAIFERLKTSFGEMLKEAFTQTPNSLEAGLLKLQHVKLAAAYSPYIFNDTALDLDYSDLNITKDDSYFEAHQKVQLQVTKKRYRQLNSRYDYDGGYINFASAMANRNLILVSPIVLLRPLFDYNWPASVKYGATGYTIGHELSHFFDNLVIHYDHTGRIQPWMEPEAMEAFNQYAKCLIDQYSQYCVQGVCLNGNYSLHENFADNAGLLASWKAYKAEVATSELEPPLSDSVFGKFTHDQLFFIMYGYAHCMEPLSEEFLQEVLLMDTHSPEPQRVVKPLENLEAFAKAFSCPAPSDPPREKKCSLWIDGAPRGTN